MFRINSDFDLLEKYIHTETEVVIDVGCGSGELVRWASRQGIDAYGIDNFEMISKACYCSNSCNEKFVIGTSQELNLFKDNFADIITFIASFHHVPAEQMISTINECKRIIKPEGKIIFIEPVAKKDTYYEIIKLVEDEAGIQKQAYQILKTNNVIEEEFYIERSLQDYIKQINLFVESEERREIIIQQATEITNRLSYLTGKNIDDFRYKSISRLIVLTKDI